MVTTNMTCLPLLSILGTDCKESLTCSQQVTPQHVQRKANFCGNFITNKGRLQAKSLINYETCPSFVYQAFNWDYRSMTTIKYISYNQKAYFV